MFRVDTQGSDIGVGFIGLTVWGLGLGFRLWGL